MVQRWIHRFDLLLNCYLPAVLEQELENPEPPPNIVVYVKLSQAKQMFLHQKQSCRTDQVIVKLLKPGGEGGYSS